MINHPSAPAGEARGRHPKLQRPAANCSRVSLSDATCEPCEGGHPLPRANAEVLAKDVPDWTMQDGRIEREWAWPDFATALAFVNRVAALAEQEGHHPDILLHGWKHVRLTLSTHAVGGLSRNDFILAAKVDALA